jgi:hypothetical protein
MKQSKRKGVFTSISTNPMADSLGIVHRRNKFIIDSRSRSKVSCFMPPEHPGEIPQGFEPNMGNLTKPACEYFCA